MLERKMSIKNLKELVRTKPEIYGDSPMIIVIGKWLIIKNRTVGNLTAIKAVNENILYYVQRAQSSCSHGYETITGVPIYYGEKTPLEAPKEFWEMDLPIVE